jgi:hypothetical protein
VTIKPVKATATSATNPKISFLAVLDTFDWVNATVGQAAMISATFWNADQSGVTVHTT